MTNITAVRTYNQPRTRATITVSVDGVQVKKLGGNRAARATKIVVAQRLADMPAPNYYAMRADGAAADAEAAKFLRDYSVVYGDRAPMTPWHFSESITITEGN